MAFIVIRLEVTEQVVLVEVAPLEAVLQEEVPAYKIRLLQDQHVEGLMEVHPLVLAHQPLIVRLEENVALLSLVPS